MMALAPLAHGTTIDGAMTFVRLLDAVRASERRDIVHVHWTTPIVQHCNTRAEALARVSALDAEIRSMQRRGGKLVWTVHNQMPHEVRHEAEERLLMRMLADRADLVHIMSPGTVELLSAIVEIDPDRVLQLAHPSYAGVYPDPLTRAQARHSFGLDHDDLAVLFVGQMRAYKGVDDVIHAAQDLEVADGRRVVLMLAGAAERTTIDQVEKLLPNDARSIVSFSRLPDHELGRWHRAADIVVLPYRQILNSGSMHLAATFETPVLIPDLPHLRNEFHREPWVHFFDTKDVIGSIRERLRTPFDRPAAASFWPFLNARSPWVFSLRYADALARLEADVSDDLAQ
ncbi:glycosyltransferase [Microbacterium tenebrionis]|uniref:glycosyltransferase n=1 Tax=Microbacterium tenebrionis TaxID=2830665 RepID=UPI00158C23FF|nr:glycosyltransferase [Microbacterium ihumii]